MSISRQDKTRGSLLGGAIGDALGYPVEFMSYSQIKSKYGEEGITRFELDKNGVAEISDDTQMTLFTANGLLFGFTRAELDAPLSNPEDYIRDSYIEWWQIQTNNVDYTQWHYNWIRDIKELRAQRAPGNTCMQALQEISRHNEVNNQSKGCGGIMRIAPIPLFYNALNNCKNDFVIQENSSAELSGEVAKITHKHPLGWLPAALLAYIIDKVIELSTITPYQFAKIINNGIKCLEHLYPDQLYHIHKLQDLLEKAGRRAVSTLSDEEAIRQIGEGWVAEETLAIAVFCIMRYPNDFERAIIASVNHSGDSDSTGSVTGNIIGALLGDSAIPSYYKEHLELKWLVEELADDIAIGMPVHTHDITKDTPEKQNWLYKYVYSPFLDVVPIKNSYLVDRELGIYAGEYPGDKDDFECKLKIGSFDNHPCEFNYFYDLTEKGELRPYRQYLGAEQEYHNFSIPDCGTPNETASVARLLNEIITRSQRNHQSIIHGHEKTYIHCWGGVGRTGTIIACYYAYWLKGQGYTADEIYQKAMDMLSESFSHCPKSKYRISPENQQQRDFIKMFIANECM